MAYNEIILDESVLDVDSWLPEFAIDKLVESLIEYQNSLIITKKMKERDESFVLMFRNFVFFDVTQYECSNGDLYVRNNVDGIILTKYFRMTNDDQLTVFKNREEFDAFMKNVEEKGYRLGPDKHIEFEKGRDWHREYIERKEECEYYKGDGVSPDKIITNWSICDSSLLKRRAIKSKVTGQFVSEYTEPELVDKVYKILQGNEQEDTESGIHVLLKQASGNSETGKIDVITSTWDGSELKNLVFFNEDEPLHKVIMDIQRQSVNKSFKRQEDDSWHYYCHEYLTKNEFMEKKSQIPDESTSEK